MPPVVVGFVFIQISHLPFLLCVEVFSDSAMYHVLTASHVEILPALLVAGRADVSFLLCVDCLSKLTATLSALYVVQGCFMARHVRLLSFNGIQ